MDRGFFLTLQAMRRQLAALPCDYYQIRLIHARTRKPFPGERVFSAPQLTREPMVRFLRLRNREGHDVFFHPFAGDHNAGYIFLDLDQADDQILQAMRAHGHEPSVVLRTSPGHLQAWVRVSLTPLVPPLATAVARLLADLYHADRASADWRHCGRLAGFTNQKPARRLPSGSAPWVRLLYAHPGLATQAAALLHAPPQPFPPAAASLRCPPLRASLDASLPPAAARAIYSRWLYRLRIPQRFSAPDWSRVDLCIAQRLLRCRIPTHQVRAVLRFGSPGFPRQHSDPEDYLRRTLARAAELSPFPARLSAAGSP